ncbi:MAG: nitrite/sulfite reductase [Thermoanaerobaculia bacterium]
MSTVVDTSTLGRTSLSFADTNEVEVFAQTLAKFEAGEITSEQWRLFRLVHGTYNQKQPEVQMLRAKIPQGVLSAAQLHALADVAERYSRGFGHITTRQNIQFHFIPPEQVPLAMTRLAEDGLTTREACGNAVRNVTACPYAGVAQDEAFDVTPYAEALTRAFLRHPLSSTLPRKFKIAFEGCRTDHALTAINDLGFRARVEDGVRGFRVTAGGGTATVPTNARVLFEFLPASDILDVAEALLRVFHALGDRVNRNQNRMKFLIREMGWDGFRAEVDAALARVRAEGGVSLSFDPERPPVESAPEPHGHLAPTIPESARRAASAVVRGPGLLPSFRAGDGLLRFLATNVTPQKQEGFRIVTVTLVLGDLTAAQMRFVADLALSYGDGTIRTSPTQNLLLRWVRAEDVPLLHARLAAAGLGLAGAGTIADITSCPGAESCRVAVTQSRGLGRLIGEHLRAHPESAAGAEELNIKISGCPNGCGQHHIAGIGFQGSVRKVAGRVVPQYFLMTGGGLDENGARFAKTAARIPARRIPEALDRVLAIYRAGRKEGETATEFFRRADLDELKEVLKDLESLTPETAVPEDFIDLGEEESLSESDEAIEPALRSGARIAVSATR